MTTDSGMDVSPSWLELKEERDALAAHVVDLQKFVNDTPYMPERHRDAERMRLQAAIPTTSLARLKSQWQAEALETEAENFKRDAKDSDSGWEKTTYMRVVRCLREAAHKARQQPKEPRS